MKKLLPAYILSFVISFMLFIVEPLSLFANNRNDLHFNLGHFFRPLLISFLIVFLGLSLIYTIFYYVNKKFSSKLRFFNIVMIISYILFILFYIQGNYMIGSLPRLDGTTPDWSIYNVENTITSIIFYIITFTYIVCCIKFKFEKVINVSKYISLAIFAMVFVSFIPTLCSKNLWKSDKTLYVSNENINSISNNKNFLILLIDAVDSRIGNNIIENSEYKNMFEDFTYYPDTISIYNYTRDSIPQILSGVTNYNKTDFKEYYNSAMDESILFDELSSKGYDINIYEGNYEWTSDKSQIVKNSVSYHETFSTKCYLENELKYTLFKYLPYFAKKWSKIEYFNLNNCKVDYNTDAFNEHDRDYYYSMNKELTKIDNNYFSFIHLDGAHVPFDLDEELNIIEDGTYEQKVKASFKIVNEYLLRLKNNGTYDNSVIIILADHGYNYMDSQGRQNPALYIKGINEHHEMYTSDKAILFSDLKDAYIDLLNDKKSTELFSNIKSTRTRKFIWYEFLKENHMIEFETDGKAWEVDKYKKTGVEYNKEG